MAAELVRKEVHGILRQADRHWVGDGFPVRTLFSYNASQLLSPFLLLDYAGPMDFPPTDERLGVGEHPHRGFETVTIVYDGEVEHRDSSGGGGRIGPGDVQWMTAASGIVHEEFHGRDFAREGGRFEMVQLWVNLPAKHKMSQPRYQAILDRDIPVVRIANDKATVRVIAGELRGAKGPANTFTPVNVWDLRAEAGQKMEFPIPDGYTTVLVVLEGSVVVNDSETLGAAEVGLFTRSGDGVQIETVVATKAVLLSGEPIDEPVVGQGPFVMNSTQEIYQAIADYRSGKMGQL